MIPKYSPSMGRQVLIPRIIGLLALSHSVIPAAVILGHPDELSEPGTLIDFERFPDGDPVPYTSVGPGILNEQWSILGVMISDNSPRDGAGAYGGTRSILPHSGTRAIGNSYDWRPGGFVSFIFISPESLANTTVSEAGLWVQNGLVGSRVRFFDADGEIIATIDAPLGDSFAGLSAPEGIGSIRIDNPDYFTVDDLQFVVPEPSSAILFLMGVGGLACNSRRRRTGDSN